jgi:hypothetical protein
VTVTNKSGGRYVLEAKARAEAWGLPFFPPGSADADALLTLGGDGWKLVDAHGSLAFTPGMAALRVKRLGTKVGGDDILLRLCELKPGDSLLDGTLGLGADALVCARAVGPKGRVIAVEASLPLFALASEGLKRAPPFTESAAIDLRHGTARAVLETLETKSIDCVIFDPMFDLPKKSTPSFDLLRRHALHEPLDQQTLDEARRVAKRWVVVKGGRDGKELERLGLKAERLTRWKPFVFARVEPS